jgi:hypothetical protein
MPTSAITSMTTKMPRTPITESRAGASTSAATNDSRC